MFFRRFYDDGLAQASYMIGCDTAGDAVVVDPTRDTAQYIDAAAAERLRISQVTETHIHADFVSGSRELARRSGAALLLSAEGGPDWQYGFARADGAALLHDGDVFHAGRVRFDVRHTPGHTPEHLVFLVTDLAASEHPVGLVSGDCVFVGDVGRPDLLERAAKVENTMEAAAHALFRSLQRVRALPDFVQLWPGHGAGSACGKALGALPQSTIGYERVANWGLIATDEAAFVREVLAGQPEPPPYFAQMKRVNRDGPPILARWPRPSRLDGQTLPETVEADGVVVDTRAAVAFAEGHAPGALNIALGRAFTNWAGWLLPYDRDLHLIAASQADADRAAGELAKIGLDRVAGWFDAGALRAEQNLLTQRFPRLPASGVAAQVMDGHARVLDVRTDAEWSEGNIRGAVHIPVGELGRRLGEVPAGQPVVVLCQGGTRSAIAASILQRGGVRDVIDVPGGYDEWAREGLPVDR